MIGRSVPPTEIQTVVRSESRMAWVSQMF